MILAWRSVLFVPQHTIKNNSPLKYHLDTPPKLDYARARSYIHTKELNPRNIIILHFSIYQVTRGDKPPIKERPERDCAGQYCGADSPFTTKGQAITGLFIG